MAVTQSTLSFTEFFYTICRDAPITMKRRLPYQYYQHFLTETKAHKFAAKSTPEQKREVLAYLGVEQFVIYADVSKMTHEDIRVLFKDIPAEGATAMTLRQLTDKGIFVSSNREFCTTLLNVASTFNTSVYVQELELIRAGYDHKGWGKKIEHEAYKKYQEEAQINEKFVKFVYGVLWAEDSCQQAAEVDAATIRILLYLFLKRGYVGQEKISHSTALTKRQVFISLRNCVNLMYVHKHPIKDEEPEYQITGAGVMAVNRFIEKVVKSLDF